MTLVNFQAGFAMHNGVDANIGYFLDEHNDLSLLSADKEDFYNYLDYLKSFFLKEINDIKDRDEDVKKTKDLDLKTINIEPYTDSNVYSRFNCYIGNLAMLSIYSKIDISSIMLYLNHNRHNAHKELLELLNESGKEARNGLSIFEHYKSLITNKVVPVFPIQQRKFDMSDYEKEFRRTRTKAITHYQGYDIYEYDGDFNGLTHYSYWYGKYDSEYLSSLTSLEYAKETIRLRNEEER